MDYPGDWWEKRLKALFPTEQISIAFMRYLANRETKTKPGGKLKVLYLFPNFQKTKLVRLTQLFRPRALKEGA